MAGILDPQGDSSNAYRYDLPTGQFVPADDSASATAGAPLGQGYVDAIKQFEGFTPKAQWDYKQHSNGYGTKATYPGEVIDQATAEQRLNAELGSAAGQVDKAFPQLPEGARAALTSLTYNAGPGWISSGLGKAVGNNDWAGARTALLQYNRAGGQVLPGLTDRRAQEAAWLTGAQQLGSPDASTMPQGSPLNAASLGQAPSSLGQMLRGVQQGMQGQGQQAAPGSLQQRLQAFQTAVNGPPDQQEQQAPGNTASLMPPPMQPIQFAKLQPRTIYNPITQFLTGRA